MSVRTGYVGTAAAGDVLTADNFNDGPGGWLGYATSTTFQSIAAAAEADVTGLSVTVTVGSSRLIRVSLSMGVGTSNGNTGTGTLTVTVLDGSTVVLTTIWQVPAARQSVVAPSVLLTPTAGSKTYKIHVAAVGQPFQILNDTNGPGTILVEDIGPAPV